MSETTKHQIVLIEDDAALRAALSLVLESNGYRVLVTGRLQEARRMLDQNPVDLAVVDGLLPDGSGVDFCSELRAKHPSAKIIFFSAFFRDLASFQKLKSQLVVDLILRKPLAPRDLLSHIGELLHVEAPAPQADDEAQSVQAELQKLRSAYLRELPARWAEAALALRKAQAQHGARALLEVAHGHLHSLHGTAGSFGLDEAAERARKLDAVLSSSLEADRSLDAKDWDYVNGLIAPMVKQEPVICLGR